MFDPAVLESSLSSMRALTTSTADEISVRLNALCAQAGVVLLFVPPLPGTHVSGVARWVGDRPLIQLSLLGKWNDVFWFSFFHEVAHILKHPKRAVFLTMPAPAPRSRPKRKWKPTNLPRMC